VLVALLARHLLHRRFGVHILKYCQHAGAIPAATIRPFLERRADSERAYRVGRQIVKIQTAMPILLDLDCQDVAP
jgi:hypothetical protein